MCFRSWMALTLLMLVPLSGMAAPRCTLSTSGMAFGTYNPAQPTPLDGITTVQLDCSQTTVYTMEASTAKINPDGSREMKAGGAAGNAIYFLYIDPSRTQVWGDGTGNTYSLNGTTAGSVVDHSIYGRVPAGQLLGAGSYKDKVLIRANF